MQTNRVLAVLTRLSLVLEAANDTELARMLGTTSSTISSWKARNSIPYAKCEEIAEDRGISLDWLLTGNGEMLRGVTCQPSPSNLSPKEEALLTMFNELSEDDQREICRLAEDKKRLRDMSKQIEELQAWFEEFKKAH